MSQKAATESYKEIRTRVRNILADYAKRKKTVTYSGLVWEAGLPFDAYSTAMNELLCDISTSEHGFGRPMLSALVVGKDGGIPGSGFYKAAKALGYDASDQLSFWADQVSRTFSTSW